MYKRNEISYSPLQWFVKMGTSNLPQGITIRQVWCILKYNHKYKYKYKYNHKVSVMYIYSMEVVSLISLTPPGLYGDTLWKTLLGWYLLERSMPGIKGNQCKIRYNSLSDSGCTEILKFTRMDNTCNIFPELPGGWTTWPLYWVLSF